MRDHSRLITVADLAKLRDAAGRIVYPASTVRGWISGDVDEFKTRCVVQIGRRVYVDLDALEKWRMVGRRTAKPSPVERLSRRYAVGLRPKAEVLAEIDALLAGAAPA